MFVTVVGYSGCVTVGRACTMYINKVTTSIAALDIHDNGCLRNSVSNKSDPLSRKLGGEFFLGNVSLNKIVTWSKHKEEKKPVTKIKILGKKLMQNKG